MSLNAGVIIIIILDLYSAIYSDVKSRFTITANTCHYINTEYRKRKLHLHIYRSNISNVQNV